MLISNALFPPAILSNTLALGYVTIIVIFGGKVGPDFFS